MTSSPQPGSPSQSSLLLRPFGLSKGGSIFTPSSTNHYFTPSDLINLSIHAVNSKVFSFETLVDQGAEGQLEVRPGSLNHVLGYSSSSSSGSASATITASSEALPFFKKDLKSTNSQNVSLNLSISGLDYDEKTGSLFSNQVSGLQFANDLGFSVFTPLSPKEVQPLSILNSVFSKTQTGNGSVFLFDGLTYAKKSAKLNDADLLSVEQSLELYQQLSTVSSQWEQLPYVERPKAALEALSKLTGSKYSPFEYHGKQEAKVVFVVYGSVESELFSKVVEEYDNAGVIAIRSPVPFNVDQFSKLIPSSAETLVIVGQALNSGSSSSSVLASQIKTALFVNGIKTSFTIEDVNYPAAKTWTSSSVREVLSQFRIAEISKVADFEKKTKEFIVWSQDKSDVVDLSPRLAHTLSLQASNVSVQYEAKFDHLKLGGVYQGQIIDNGNAGTFAGAIDSADLVYVDNSSIFNEFDVAKTVKKEGFVLLRSDEIASFKDQDVESFIKENLSNSVVNTLVENKNKLVLINPNAIGKIPEIQGFGKLITSLVAFWSFAYPEFDINELVRKILISLASDLELLPAVLVSIVQEKILPLGIKEVGSLAKFVEKSEEKDTAVLPAFPLEHGFKPSSINVGSSDAESKAIAQSNTKLELFKRLAFQDNYTTVSSLRPDVAPKTHSIKVKEIRRLTPDSYDRNIIHIEFDLTETEGFKYDIGEALGVHGRNNESQVKEFLEWYGLTDAQINEVVELKNKENESLVELRTVFQLFVEQFDIFGKPGKAFYESLAQLATDAAEKTKLTNLVSPEGAAELKKFQDVEYYTYADVFQLFPSAKPVSIQELIHSGLIPALHRREYSISSSQNYNPTALHLLIVVVEWRDSQSRRRFGQCSKYLSELSIGDSVTVSLKPSMMKLPPLSTQPMIMAGLGTGLAPFKAMIEERLYQRDQLGLDVGEVYLYLGSRHQREEYLYGELWEAYLKDGILTHLGAAFSRDQKEKIYIQDKIREDVKPLSDLVVKKKGVFYLCGPTWPVPDITEVLEDIVANEAKERGVEVDKFRAVEDMKEESRYILEVY
ncbi:hypothetical protein WICPIJ_009804 [Wickerhamomyces pijperi]|uniref:assimilatory sulfite reductase (NADPH) n=1 Tax=Wickerhamomyces pijperi TaxID=599730 RepID=A0A9P8TCN3_WICPI|nr:hypothetical protein WICPIJ_009804 [Wickerhamomyces pijperi]